MAIGAAHLLDFEKYNVKGVLTLMREKGWTIVQV